MSFVQNNNVVNIEKLPLVITEIVFVFWILRFLPTVLPPLIVLKIRNRQSFQPRPEYKTILLIF